jgi:hypothetical protein
MLPPAVYLGMPNAGAIMLLASLQSAITPVFKPALLRSASICTLGGGEGMEEQRVWGKIERLKRQLDENKVEMIDVIARQKRVKSGQVGSGEYECLEAKFNELIKKEDALRAELARLIVIAVRQRLSRADMAHLIAIAVRKRLWTKLGEDPELA